MDNRVEEDEKPIDVSQEGEPSVEGVNSDEKALAELGYKSRLKREFSLISCLAFGFSVRLLLFFLFLSTDLEQMEDRLPSREILNLLTFNRLQTHG